MIVRLQPSLTGTIDGDENTTRGNWSRQLDFLLSCFGYAVGLGNVWRFPYLSYVNGGGAFFIPFFIMMVFVGMPVFFLELSIGQFTSRGPVAAYKFSRLFQGVAIGMVLVSATASTYYAVIIAWSLFYLFASFTNKLPWATCDKEWNTEFCLLRTPDVDVEYCLRNTSEFYRGICSESNGTRIGVWNNTLAELHGFKRVMPASEYFQRRVLKESDGIDSMGGLSWELSLCLLLTWIIVYLTLFKGVKSSGKVVYFTALFPYAVLVILFIRGLTLPGAGNGVSYYLTPRWEKLKDAGVWRDAASQVFFSFSCCWGGLFALSSYNRFHNNILRDAILVSIGNSATSVFAGFVIYSFIGNLAYQMKTDVDKVSQDGAGLAFVIYPMAVLSLPGSPFWSILFFIMLLTLGIDTQFALVETVTTTIFDYFPNLLKKKQLVILSACLPAFAVGLIYTCGGGKYILKLVDGYVSGWNVFILCIFELTTLSFVYGYKRFAMDIKIMIGREPPFFWRICLQGLAQVILIFVVIFDWSTLKALTYGNYEYPGWANVIGWIISSFAIIPVPMVALYAILKSEGRNLLERIRNASKPAHDWGPDLPMHRQLVDYVPDWQIYPSSHSIKASEVMKISSIPEIPRPPAQTATATEDLQKQGGSGTQTTVGEQTIHGQDAQNVAEH